MLLVPCGERRAGVWDALSQAGARQVPLIGKEGMDSHWGGGGRIKQWVTFIAFIGSLLSVTVIMRPHFSMFDADTF